MLILSCCNRALAGLLQQQKRSQKGVRRARDCSANQAHAWRFCNRGAHAQRWVATVYSDTTTLYSVSMVDCNDDVAAGKHCT